MTLIAINEHLKDTPVEHKRTHAGMAHFAGSGPQGAHCSKCHFWSNDIAGAKPRENLKAALCLEYKHLMYGKVGPKVPAGADACKYFRRRENG